MQHNKEEINDIAVIGMAGRFPMAGNLEEFWMNVKRGKYCVGEIPGPRMEDWRSSANEDGMPYFGYMHSISGFDAQFFNIPPGEAQFIDPCQRLLLEVVSQAFESGGYGGKKIANTGTGIFIACSNSGYRDLISPDDYSITAEVGNLPAVSAGRISHFFDLRGPSLLIDTACSSSLTALHYACESLKRNECSMTVVAAASIYAYFKRIPTFNDSEEHREYVANLCRVFDDSTSGIVNGEGVGALLLKPLPAALKDGDHICAVIKGTALSHSGARTAAISGQNPEALAETISMGLQNAGIDPHTITYMEASGTATQMGDPIEIKAISDAFSSYTGKKQFCAVGSVKANLGHLNHASGLASLIKVILALQHKQIPPLARFEKANSYIDFENSPLYIDKELKNWDLGENKTRRAGVSSFSVNGTNCHVVMEEAPQPQPLDYPQRWDILTLSAKNQESMQTLGTVLKESLSQDSPLLLQDVCYTMNTGRGQYEYRHAVVCENKEQCIQGLNALQLENLKKTEIGEAKAVFLFPGGKEADNPLETCWDFYRKGFRAANYMDQCAAFYDLEKYPQALLFSFQYALAELWMDLGIKPAFVLGFGIGKYVSRVISGKLELKEALDICVTEYNREDFHRFNKDKLSHHIAQLYSRGQTLFLGMGSENDLAHMTHAALKGKPGFQVLLSYDSALKEKTLLTSIGHVYTRGIDLDFSSLYQGRKVALPTYPFQHRRYWVKAVAQPGVQPSALQTFRPGRVSDAVTLRQVEETLFRMWQTFFGIEKISIREDFFKLGGDSLRAMTIISEIHKKLHVNVPLVEFFSHPTIAELAQYIKKAEKSTFFSIEPVEKKEYYPISSAQRRLYILYRIAPKNTSYNMPIISLLEGVLDKRKVERTFQEIIRHHESFRTSFLMKDDQLFQQVADTVPFHLEFYDLTILDNKENLETEKERIMNQFIRPFDLSRAPLVRLELVKIEEEKHILLYDIHHIISDGVSTGIFIREFMDFYDGRQPEPFKIQYKDYAQWQDKEKINQNIKKQEEYWLKRYESGIPILSLPQDFPRPEVQTFDGEVVAFIIDREETAALKLLALERSTTLYMVLISIYYILLYKLNGQEDIVIGAPTAGRTHEGLQDIIGVFLNTLALRCFPGDSKPFKRFLAEVKENTLKAFENQEYQFEDLVEKLEVKRDTGRNPIFQVMFILQTQQAAKIEIPGLQLKNIGYRAKTSKFDLSLDGMEIDGEVHFNLSFSTKLFSLATTRTFTQYYKNIVSAVLKDADQALVDLDILSEKDRAGILSSINADLEDEAAELVRNGVFQTQLNDNLCTRFKDNIAIKTGSQVLSYGQLDRQSDIIAHWLQKNSIPRQTFIGVLSSDRVELIYTIIGIIKAGCVMVPLYDGYPDERLADMVRSTHLQYIFVDETNAPRIQALKEVVKEKLEIIYSKHLSRDGENLKSKTPVVYNPGDQLYIFFTSGTTGKPKAIVGKNRSLLHFIKWETEAFNISSGMRFSQFTIPVFDPFLRDVFAPLYAGGTICIPEGKAILLHAEKLAAWLDKERIAFIHCVPSLFRLICSAPLDSSNFSQLKNILLAGEKTNPSDLGPWYDIFADRIQLVNCYGPTETTLSTVHHLIQPSDARRIRVPIGKPMKGSRVLILDGEMKLCPPLKAGEICIRTPFRSNGYYDDTPLNNSKFIPNPFSEDSNDILYRSGDQALYSSDGTIDILGRIDRQVKMRGYRIELEEIEGALTEHRTVKEAVVIKREFTNQQEFLCAYVTLASGADAATGNELHTGYLKEYLAIRLPDYMVPAKIVILDQMPRRANSKVDYNRLPDPLSETAKESVLPANPIEEKLLTLWKEVLKLEDIDVDDRFFDLGGNSLNIMALSTKIHREFDIRLSLGELFKHQTIRAQAGLMHQKTVTEKYIPIKKAGIKPVYQLSPAQRRLYTIHQLDPLSTAYNILSVMTLEGTLNSGEIEAAVNGLIQRHESLRTTFEISDGIPLQRVHRHLDFKIEHFHITAGLSHEHSEGQIIEKFAGPFDLSRLPLLRVGLIKIHPEEHILMIDIHHIVTDVTSIKIMAEEFMELYSQRQLPPLALQYKDFSQWQNSPQYGEEVKKQEQYWLRQLNGELPVLNLPIDFPRPPVRSFEGRKFSFQLTQQQTLGLNNLASNEGATLYMVLITVFNILLAKLSGQEDIIVAAPTTGRRHWDLQKIIGMFVNTLPIRSYPQGTKSFQDFLGEVRGNTLDAFENQDYQFEDLVGHPNVSVYRDNSRNPIFDVLFQLGVIEIPSLEIAGLTLKPYPMGGKISKFDITLFAVETNRQLLFTLEYCTRLFKEETIRKISAYFKQLADTVLHDPSVTLADIEIISQEEKLQVVEEFNNTRRQYPVDKCICSLFDRQVEQTPDSAAVVYEDQSLTYSQLQQWAGILAASLLDRGVTPEEPVGIMMEAGVGMVAGVLGILKAGAAYLPLNPAYPETRKKYLLNDAGSRYIITNMDDHILYSRQLIDPYEYRLPGPNNDNPPLPDSTAHRLAYIIYTSGSTGKPKGVMVEHRSVVRLVKNTNFVQFRQGMGLLQSGALEFDASTVEIWGSLLNGLRLHLASQKELLAPESLKQLIEKNHIDIMWLTAPLFNQMVNQDAGVFAALGTLMVGGDALSPPHINKVYDLYPHLNLINGYGPTENTTFSTTFPIEGKFQRNIPIGKPIANSSAYILDQYMKPVSIGIRGELVVGGDGIARGYLNNPELTHDKFPRHTFPGFSAAHNNRLYRTGDLARWLPDGNIEFAGRMDNQVKLRGFRIELGEIEQVLLSHSSIKEAVVTFVSPPSSNAAREKALCAYIVSGEELSIPNLKRFLSQQLPTYMIPVYFIRLEKMPLNANGKVLRKALPQPRFESPDLPANQVIPKNPTEEKLAGIWAGVLAIEEQVIGVHSDFFELGGHSLKATLLTSKIHKTFNAKLLLAEIFTAPTLREMARAVGQASEDTYYAIEAVEKRSYYPLSSAQLRLFILNRMESQSTGYNISAIFLLEGRFDKKRVEDTFMKMIERHESLRTSFETVAGHTFQKIWDNVDFQVRFRVWDNWSENIDMETAIQEYIQPFDLSQAPLMRVAIIQLTAKKHLLILDMHHIITDGISLGIIAGDFMTLYQQRHLPDLRIQYKDYSSWHNKLNSSGILEKQAEFWKNKFSDSIPVFSLPTDFIRPTYKSFEGDAIGFNLDAAHSVALKEIAMQEKTTLFMLLLAVFNILMAKLSAQEDIVVGTPIAGRRHEDLKQVIGMFVNTLALRNLPAAEMSFTLFLEQLKNHTLEAFENQEFPFEELVNQLNLVRDVSRNPIFDVMFAMQNIDSPQLEIPGLKLSSYNYKKTSTQFDLTLEIVENDDTLSAVFKYCSDLFKPETIQRFVSYFRRIVSSIIDNADKKIADLEIIPQLEKEQILYQFNDMDAEAPAYNTLHQLFEEQAAQTPNHIAVTGYGQGHGKWSTKKDLSLTYKQLNEKSSGLARILREKGVAPDIIVGMMVERSLEMIIGILGILKAGGAYLPIEPNYPQQRISYMLADSNTKLVLTTRSTEREKKLDFHAEMVYIEDTPHGSFDSPGAASPQLCYIIYTSGTTGKPKGAMIEHRNLVSLLFHENSLFDFNPGDTWTMFHSYCFDFSVWEMYGALLFGGKLVLISPIETKDPALFLQVLREQKVTVLNQTPQAFYNLMDQVLMHPAASLNIRYIIFGGDALSPLRLIDWRRKYPRVRLINMFGITETTVHVTFKELDNKDIEENTGFIGKPLPSLKVYVMDRGLKLLPLMVAGEACVGGFGLARGYLNRPELSAEKFVSNPYFKGEMLYRSGDLVRMIDDGQLEYLGRIDHQVKIRGYRIELGEIENTLLKHPAVNQAVVVDIQDNEGVKFLCAYLVATAGDTQLKEYLSSALPDYMVPAHFVFLEKIPITASGKVDRKSLPRPEIKTGTQYAPPRDQLERTLVEIWVQLLGLEENRIGIDDNFFELGGHSLKATQLIYNMHKAFDVEIQLKEIFSQGTIRELAQLIVSSESMAFLEIEPVEKKEYYPVSYAQRRLWILCQFEADSIAYNIPGALEVSGTFDAQRFAQSIRALVDRHESLRTVFLEIHGQLFQRVLENVDAHLQVIDLHRLEQEHRDEEAKKIYIDSAQNAFDLVNGPLFLFKLIKLEHEKYLLIYNIHHIISDGWSQGVINNDVLKFYHAFAQDPVSGLTTNPVSGLTTNPVSGPTTNPVTPLKIQYKDYTQWHKKLTQGGEFNELEAYWLEKFKDKPNGIILPTDHPRASIQTFNGGRVNLSINEENTRKLKQLAGDSNATLFMGLYTIFAIFLHRYSGEKDIIVGSPIAGRRHPELQDMVGFLVNTLVFRNTVESADSFTSLLQNVRTELMESYENQDYPFDLMVEKLNLFRDMSQSPIFNVMLAHNNTDIQDDQLGIEGVGSSGYKSGSDFNMSKFDLTFFMDMGRDVINILIEFNSDLFERSTAQRMGDNFTRLMETVVNNPETAVKDLDYINKDEYETLLLSFNDTDYNFPQLTIQQLFEQQVEKTSAKTAVVWGGEAISYEDLNCKANRLAHYLRKEYRIKPNDIIGVFVDRSIELIIVILGIIKSGGGYVAIDPNYPQDRLRHMLEDSDTKLIIADSEDSALLSNYDGHRIYIHSDWNKMPTDTRNPELVNQMSDNVYVIYTSGSTGMPNGAMLSHGILGNLVQWQREKTAIDSSMRCLQFTSINFCVSFQEIVTTLGNGGEIHMIGDVERQDIEYLMDFLSTHKIEILYLPFSYLNFLFNESSRWGENFQHHLKHIITAGEQLKITAGLKQFLEKNPHMQLHNHYGSSEMHVVTSYTLDASSASQSELPPAGRPISNTRIYILDENNRVCPIGVWGELCIAGSFEVSGYINNLELTRQKVLAHPQLCPERLYHSGDIGRWQADGYIQLKGRKDNQIKIRGFRVEPGEIESKITMIDRIKDCVVVVKDGPQGKYLVAYIVADNIDAPEIVRILSGYLPTHMIPSMVLLDAIPLMPNGKVDREHLPEPQLEVEGEYLPPRDQLDWKLAEIWSSVLGLEKEAISIDASFFELGGHSLKATTLSSLIHKELDVRVALLDIFKSPTITELAEKIKNLSIDKFVSIEPAEYSEYYPLSSAQMRLYLLQQMDTASTAYNMPEIIPLGENWQHNRLEETFKQLIHRHENLRTSFHMIDENPVQKIHSTVDFKIEYHETASPIDYFIRPFDLGTAPLIRVALVNKSPDQCILLVDIHHIISDGVSRQVLVQDFTTLYEGGQLTPLKLQYKDFSMWQQRENEKGIIKLQEKYWLNVFKDGVPTVKLPTDYPAESGIESQSRHVRFTIESGMTENIRAMVTESNSTLFIFMLANYNILLSKYSTKEDLVVGIPIAGRRHVDLQRVIGMFVNMLPIRSLPTSNKTFMEFHREVKRDSVAAFDNQDYQFEQLIIRLGLQRNSSKNPMVETVFGLDNFGAANSNNSQTQDNPTARAQQEQQEPQKQQYSYKRIDAKFDLTLSAQEYKDRIEFVFEYREKLFTEKTIRQMGRHFTNIIDEVMENPDILISAIRMLDKVEIKSAVMESVEQVEEDDADFDF